MARAAFRSSQAGVSLVEVLAAVAIIALLSGAVVVYWASGSGPARDAADRLALRLSEAREHVLVTGETLGFAADIDGTGWRFYRFRDGVWTVVEDHPALQPERLGAQARLRITEGALPRREGETDLLAPEVLFDPGGFDAPFAYELRDREGRIYVRRTDAGAVQVETAGADRGRAA
jgi:type II secretion system protein H